MPEEERDSKARLMDEVCEWRNVMVDKFLGLFPRRTAEHLINAQKEGMLAVRSLLDRGVEVLDSDLRRIQDRR